MLLDIFCYDNSIRMTSRTLHAMTWLSLCHDASEVLTIYLFIYFYNSLILQQQQPQIPVHLLFNTQLLPPPFVTSSCIYAHQAIKCKII